MRGEGPDLILFGDLGCAGCAADWPQLTSQPVRLVFRHFPIEAKHPRAPALHAAAEAAGLQGAFWEFCDSIYGDHGHQDDPHLWQRIEALGLDLERFNADRRSAAVLERVQRDVEEGLALGIVKTPATFSA